MKAAMLCHNFLSVKQNLWFFFSQLTYKRFKIEWDVRKQRHQSDLSQILLRSRLQRNSKAKRNKFKYMFICGCLSCHKMPLNLWQQAFMEEKYSENESLNNCPVWRRQTHSFTLFFPERRPATSWRRWASRGKAGAASRPTRWCLETSGPPWG